MNKEKSLCHNLLNNIQSGLFIYKYGRNKIKFVNEYLKQYDEFKKEILSPSNDNIKMPNKERQNDASSNSSSENNNLYIEKESSIRNII